VRLRLTRLDPPNELSDLGFGRVLGYLASAALVFLGMNILWYTPTRYCELNPVTLGLGVKSCTASGMNMCVGPSGDVYPCQSYFESLGKFLETDWKRIWNHALSKRLRNHAYAPEDCKECGELSVCGAGCPLELGD